MASLKDISSSRVRIFNPYALFVTPYVKTTDSSGKVVESKGTNYYKLDEVIRDTTTITQEDPTENKIENEFSSAPIINNVQLGSYTFSAEVADMQSELLQKLCGYTVSSGTGAKVDRTYAPANYTPIYAEIALVFKTGQDASGNDTYLAAVLPKVQLNSKATFDSLSSSMGRITLAGTGLNVTVDNVSTPFYIDSSWTETELA